MVTGLVFLVANFSNIGLQVGLTIMGALMSILFLGCFLADKNRCLTIGVDKIVLPRGADKNGKTVFHKTVIKFDDIKSVESKLYKGDKIVSNGCFFHTIMLKDGTKITFTLYAYGNDAEKEILETIKKSI